MPVILNPQLERLPQNRMRTSLLKSECARIVNAHSCSTSTSKHVLTDSQFFFSTFSVLNHRHSKILFQSNEQGILLVSTQGLRAVDAVKLAKRELEGSGHSADLQVLRDDLLWGEGSCLKVTACHKNDGFWCTTRFLRRGREEWAETDPFMQGMLSVGHQ